MHKEAQSLTWFWFPMECSVNEALCVSPLKTISKERKDVFDSQGGRVYDCVVLVMGVHVYKWVCLYAYICRHMFVYTCAYMYTYA